MTINTKTLITVLFNLYRKSIQRELKVLPEFGGYNPYQHKYGDDRTLIEDIEWEL